MTRIVMRFVDVTARCARDCVPHEPDAGRAFGRGRRAPGATVATDRVSRV